MNARYLAVLAVLAGACNGADPPALAPVPDQSQRLLFDLPAGDSLPQSLIEEFTARVECLVGSNGREAERCADPDQRDNIAACTTRGPAMVAPVRRIFAGLPRLSLTTLDSALVDIPRLFPGHEGTRHVRDARRAVRCETWGSVDQPGRPPKCVAILSGDIWLLLSGPPGPQSRVEQVEVFLNTADVCEDRLRPGERFP